ncbi:hypothetical protein [Streptomyces sp. NPDC058701]|uniref:hypothetical protein n=1 Tax=Streptomyces sp. NPDC058701 TaxID=3346608 RepID=UPI00365FCBFC
MDLQDEGVLPVGGGLQAQAGRPGQDPGDVAACGEVLGDRVDRVVPVDGHRGDRFPVTG